MATSAGSFEEYLISTDGLKLPRANVKSFFDEPFQPGELIDKMRSFLETKLSENSEISDVIFYYCGHGAYLREDEYTLALKCTGKATREATGFKIRYLVDIIGELTREVRNIVFLDACYSGAAIADFSRMSDDSDARAETAI